MTVRMSTDILNISGCSCICTGAQLMVSAGSGTIDVKELKTVMEAVGQHCSDAELTAMLNEVQSQHVQSSRLQVHASV